MPTHESPSLLTESDVEPEPIETVAQFISDRKWPMQRLEQAIYLQVFDECCDCHVVFDWRARESLMHFTLSFNQIVKKRRLDEYQKLIGLINRCLDFGHLERHQEKQLTMFRCALPLIERDIAGEEVEFMLQQGLRVAEAYRYFFDLVATGLSAEETFQKGQLLVVEEGSKSH